MKSLLQQVPCVQAADSDLGCALRSSGAPLVALVSLQSGKPVHYTPWRGDADDFPSTAASAVREWRGAIARVTSPCNDG